MGSSTQREEICERQSGSQHEQQRPKRQQGVAAFVGVVVKQQRGEREEKRRGEQSEGGDARPESLDPNHKSTSATTTQGSVHSERGIAIDAEHEAESRQAPLAGILDGPVKVVAEAGGAWSASNGCRERDARAGKNGEQVVREAGPAARFCRRPFSASDTRTATMATARTAGPCSA